MVSHIINAKKATPIYAYTVRMVLKILGVEDYGIYNVVGGTVSLLSFVVNSMASASQRYLSFELGSGDHGALKGIFNTILTVYNPTPKVRTIRRYRTIVFLAICLF